MDQHCYHRRVVMSHTAANIAASSTLAHSQKRSKRLKKNIRMRDDPSICWCHGCSATPHLYHGVIWNESAQEYEAQIPRDGGVLTSVGFRTTAVAAAKLYDVEMRKVHNETAQYKLNFPFSKTPSAKEGIAEPNSSEEDEEEDDHDDHDDHDDQDDHDDHDDDHDDADTQAKAKE